MKKIYLLFSFILLIAGNTFGQSTAWEAADSAKNVVKPGSGPVNPVWTVTGQPLMHNGSVYTTQVWGGGFNTNMDYVYFYDFGFNVPTTATITGVEVIVKRYGCNGGDHAEDTVKLAYAGNYMGNYISGMMPDSGATDTIGGPTNLWGNLLTPAMVNSYTFGVFFTNKAYGTCTMVIGDLRVKVHYTSTTGIEGVVESKDIGIYPNPSGNNITINAAGAYTISDQLGKVVLRGTEPQVDISSLAPGLYFVKSGDAVAKFVKQ